MIDDLQDVAPFDCAHPSTPLGVTLSLSKGQGVPSEVEGRSPLGLPGVLTEVAQPFRAADKQRSNQLLLEFREAQPELEKLTARWEQVQLELDGAGPDEN